MEAEDLLCALCGEVYEMTTRDPVMLPNCGHTFCRPCLLHVERVSKFKTFCPACRKRHGDQAVKYLPVNVTVLKLATAYLKTRQVTQQSEVCKFHEQQLEYWCNDCHESICKKCNYEEHLPNGHEVVKTRVILREKKKEAEYRASFALRRVEREKQRLLEKVKNSLMGFISSCRDSAVLATSAKEVKVLVVDAKMANDLSSMKTTLMNLDNMMREVDTQTDHNQKDEDDNDLKLNNRTPADLRKLINGLSQPQPGQVLGKTMWPLTCCVHNRDGRRGRLSWEDGRLHLYALREQADDAHVMVQMSLISSVIPLDSPEVFLDLSSECEYFGRVYIQLWGHLRRANQFLALCLGTLGPTYIDSHFFEAYGRNQPGECLHGGEYMINNRKSGQGLMEDLEWGDQWQLTQEEGMIVGAGNGRAERNTCFDICTIGNPLKEFACPFGRVISGLDVVKRAIHHNPVRQVTISECGFLVPFTTL